MAAQMKQLEQRLMGLRGELREKEQKARQAEGSVQDLKLQLDDLQVCCNTDNVSFYPVHWCYAGQLMTPLTQRADMHQQCSIHFEKKVCWETKQQISRPLLSW